MARKAPSADTYRLLYVRSGNKCAFPGCNHPIFNDKGTYVAELCHIKGANKGGERYDANQTDEERRAPDNLMFMCHRHHKETDDVKEYTVDRLNEIKRNHEDEFTQEGMTLSESMILQVLHESEYFWKRLKDLRYEFEDFKILRDFNSNLFELFEELDNRIKSIQEYCDLCATSDGNSMKDLEELCKKAEVDFEQIVCVPYYENPFVHRLWEMHNIGNPNLFSELNLCIGDIKVKILEEVLKSSPSNEIIKEALEKYRIEFEDLYKSSYYVD